MGILEILKCTECAQLIPFLPFAFGFDSLWATLLTLRGQNYRKGFYQ